MNNVVDGYCWLEKRKVLTPEETGVTALKTFGYTLNNKAADSLGPHIHLGCLEIVVMTKGTQVFRTGEGEYTLGGHDVFVTYPDEEHSTGGHPMEVAEFYWLQLDLTQRRLLGLDGAASAELRNSLQSLKRVFHSDAVCRAWLAEAFSWYTRPDPAAKRYAERLLTACLYRLLLISGGTAQALSPQIQAALDFLDSHVLEPVPLEEAANAAGLSLSRFKARFKEETGVTPRDYINHEKIRRARELLLQTGSVTRTAMDLGFNTANYFSVIFKKYTNRTPSEFLQDNISKN